MLQRLIFVVTVLAMFCAWASAPAGAHVAGPGDPCPHKDPNHAHCTGGGGGDAVTYAVSVVQGTFVGTSLVYRPADLDRSCVATSWENDYNVVFPRHDLCATVTVLTPTGPDYFLTDDIVITVNTQAGCITSLQLRGQDTIGREGIMHESELVAFDEPACPPAGESFTLQVHQDDIPIWKLKKHLGGPRVEMVGTISLGDFVYTVAQ